MASNRWVAIDPDILTHPLVGAGQTVAPADPSRGAYSRMEAWVWIICNASFADHAVYNRGRKMTLQRGDLLGAWAFLAHTFNWSAKTVRVWVEKLIDDNMLQRRAVEEQSKNVPAQEDSDQGFYGNQASILSVVNYWRFQFDGAESRQPAGNQKDSQNGAQLGNQPERSSAEKTADKYILPVQQGQPEGQPLGQPEGQHITREINNNVVEALEKSGKRIDKKKRSADRALALDAAVMAYNGAAEQFDFAVIKTITEPRLRRLEKRIDEIGGHENFKLALSMIPHNKFLMGQAPTKDGRLPFRLDFDRLLSTESGLGDVLASLLDRAASGQSTLIGPNGKPWGWWRPLETKIKTLDAAYWRRALKETKPNGTWPWWILTAPPGHPECLMHPDVIEEEGLIAIYQGRISHE